MENFRNFGKDFFKKSYTSMQNTREKGIALERIWAKKKRTRMVLFTDKAISNFSYLLLQVFVLLVLDLWQQVFF